MFASCPTCPGFVPPGASACPHCGAQIEAAEPQQKAGRSLTETLGKVGAAAGLMVTLMACYGSPGDFADDGFIGCQSDLDCPSGTVCDEFGSCNTPEQCFNGTDDDFDGLTDSADDDCEAFETVCDDGYDDDGDGLVDCHDPNCTGSVACLEDCGNGIDDDADGLVDCADTNSCSACPATETECGNFFDDDQDGLTDCDDDDCTGVCLPPVCGDGLIGEAEECDDGNTVSADGCSAGCLVEKDLFCAEVPVLSLGQNPGDNVAATSAFSSSCVLAGGQEAVYSFTAAADGTLYLSLQADQDMGVYVEAACETDAGELACANAVPGGQLESASVVLTAGQTVYVVADGAGFDAGGPFVLTATFVE